MLSLEDSDARKTRKVVGVVGAGTMGAGIAQVAAQGGTPAVLHDPLPGAVARGLATISENLERSVARGRLTADDAAAARQLVSTADGVADLSDCHLVIEAVPEDFSIKVRVLEEVAAVVSRTCVLATNTSSLSVTEIAAAVAGPERVVGMHFFNPVPAMALMELIAGEETNDASVDVARAAGVAMGKTVIDATDVAGFLVNRVNRPYSLEALRLLEQRVADVPAIDRIARLAGGFRMGPFELMDLIGIDTNHAVAESFLRRSYGEPRYRPSPLAARKIAAGHLGRKAGRGWYGPEATTASDAAPTARPAADARGSLVVAGTIPAALAFAAAARTAGWSIKAPSAAAGTAAYLALDFGQGDEELPAGVPIARSLHRGSLHGVDPRAAGFHFVPPLGGLVEVTTTALTDPEALTRLVTVLESVGVETEHVADAPGLVLGRIVCQLVNEAAFAIGEGNGTASDVDAGLRHGVNHPRGPVEWAGDIGLDHVLAVLDALRHESGEERYRAAPLLRQCHAVGAALGDCITVPATRERASR